MRGRSDDAGPDDPVISPSELVENVLGLLEDAGCPAGVNDQIVKLIEGWEFGREGQQSPEACPACGSVNSKNTPEADARLIAAAPELLDELKRLVKFAKDAGWHPSNYEAAEAAIGKAEAVSR